MLLAAATILLGFIILIWSADLFVDGAASIAQNLGMSPIIIGLTIVSLGTSAPEILVSITATTNGAGALAIGNAIGSNIANIALVLGVTVLVAPLLVNESCMKKELPVLLITTIWVAWLLRDDQLAAFEGWLMVAVLFLIGGILAYIQLREPEMLAQAADEPGHDLKPLRAWLTFIIGLLLLIGSSRMLVYGAVMAAKELGVSELVIGLTIVAIGTSLPELAATIASAMRGHTEIALGNIIGSNLFNLLAVMSIPGIIAAQTLEPDVMSRDYPIMAFLTLFLVIAIYIGRKRSKSRPGHSYLGRMIGTVLVSFYALYYYLLHQTI